MKDAKTYREYAADCIRMSKLMSPTDREALLKMAQAWEDRAREAEKRNRREEFKYGDRRIPRGSAGHEIEARTRGNACHAKKNSGRSRKHRP